ARQGEEAARARLDATEQRARLANESRGFFEKSFRLGETDLPTRLRIEAEAAEAEREAARARVELAASVSALRQALGLLPE
ncbi:MAG: transporter, partial [Phenylobacterium sp.]|nr:transporter [Phenylobacterium sp.]